jgi:hypothetical protein
LHQCVKAAADFFLVDACDMLAHVASQQNTTVSPTIRRICPPAVRHGIGRRA